MTRAHQGGFGIVSAIFVLVVLAALAAVLVSISSLQHAASALDLQSARAYQAARAGTQWGVSRILDQPATPATFLPDCWSSSESLALTQDLAPFTVSVTCTGPASGTELTRTIGMYRISATATIGVANQPNRVARTVEVTVSRCLNASDARSHRC